MSEDREAQAREDRETAAQRRAKPTLLEIATALADKEGVCVKPMVQQRVDQVTGEIEYVPIPCGNTRESVCKFCATRNRNLRIEQCREGWHLDHEPADDKTEPTPQQTELLTRCADLIAAHTRAVMDGNEDQALELRAEFDGVREQLRETGMRGRLPSLDPPQGKRARRSTRRRQDAPNLPRRKVAKTTVGKVYAGKYQPSMMITLTLDSYGGTNRDGAVGKNGEVCGDGTPRRPDTYDYRRAGRDIVHFSSLVDRWIQNLRRVVGYDVQYFASVEPQKRGAPHIHIAVRGSFPHKTIEMVTMATYHQVWWPQHDELRYPGSRLPYWDAHRGTFLDPDTHQPLTAWDDALEALAEDPDAQPAHVARFGTEEGCDSKGFLAGTEEAGQRIGYVCKYLTKSVGEVLEATTERQYAHYERLHAELQITPCSPRCQVWLRYGIVPKGATAKTQPGHCKGKAHRRETVGLPGRRVLVSRRWTGKTLPDHRADRAEFVRQMLAEIGITKPSPEPGRFAWYKVQPGDPNVPPREYLIMAAVSRRSAWKAEYARAKLAADAPPDDPKTSATQQAA